MNIRVYLSRIRKKIKINESKKIKKLLDSYFEGKISISQEIVLGVYFTSTKETAFKCESHRVFFRYYNIVSMEVFPVKESKYKSLTRPWMLAAGMLALIVSIQLVTKIGNKDKGPKISKEEMEFVFYQFKVNIKKPSLNFNKLTQKIGYIDYFEKTKQKSIKLLS